MKKIFETASSMVIPAIVFVAIIGIIIGTKPFTRIGQRMDVQSEDFSSCQDTATVENVCTRNAPSITYTGKKIWSAREAIHTDTAFHATDTDGNALTVKIHDITDENGTSAMDSYQAGNHIASFSRRGVYTFRVSAMDSERKSTEKKFSLVVDGR